MPVASAADVAAQASRTVRELRWADERDVAAMLARAFVDDPLVMAICEGTAAQRLERMRWSFRVALRSHCLAAQPGWTVTDATAGALGAVLVTDPRARTRAAASDFWFAARGALHVGLRATLRGVRAAQLIGAQAPAPPFTYLRTLGVDPAAQGHGVGSQLVDHVVRTAAADWPIYLETAKRRNLPFYARHGFSCIGEFRCLGVPVWRLLRTAAG